MREKNSTFGTGKQRARKGNGRRPGSEAPERPPESAEDFEHTLRRLLALRREGRGSEKRPGSSGG
jgi:hypothetical protein